jgi:hypothetical protein
MDSTSIRNASQRLVATAKRLRTELLQTKAELERELGRLLLHCLRSNRRVHWVPGVGAEPGHWAHAEASLADHEPCLRTCQNLPRSCPEGLSGPSRPARTSVWFPLQGRPLGRQLGSAAFAAAIGIVLWTTVAFARPPFGSLVQDSLNEGELFDHRWSGPSAPKEMSWG